MLSGSRIVRLLPARATARLVLRYWRVRAAAYRRLSSLKRSDGLSVLSHGSVLALGLMLAVPFLPGWTAQARPVQARIAYTPTVLALPMGLSGHNAFQLTELARELKDYPPPPPPPPPPPQAPARPAAPRPPTVFVPPPGSGGRGLSAIYAVFNGSPGLTWALRVANCESHYNPLAVNRSSGASGLFQFMPSTWNANFPGWNIWDPTAQSRAALTFYNAGRQSAWSCK